MLRRLALCLTAVAVSGCASISAADQQRGYEVAQHFRPQVEGEACIIAFKQTMNDPSSFQLAGSFTYFSVMHGVTHAVDVIFTAPIRGKNAMGGLVLQTMTCGLGENLDGTVSVDMVFSH